MARTINAGDTKVTREDTFFIDPREAVIDFQGNGRWKPLDHRKVVELARSFLSHGQQAPCLARQIEDKRIQICAGFHRHAAGLLIRNGDVESGIEARPDFKIHVRVKPMNAGEGFVANVIENKKRNQTSAVDDAHNLRRLRDMGKSDEEISSLFECRSSWLGRLELLLNLPDDIKLAVHDRRIPVSKGIEMGAMSEADRREILAQSVEPDEEGLPVDVGSVAEKIDSHALTPGAKVNGKKLAQATRNIKAAKGGRVSRSVAEIRSFLDETKETVEKDSAKSLLDAFRDFVNGKRQAPWMKEQIEKYAR